MVKNQMENELTNKMYSRLNDDTCHENNEEEERGRHREDHGTMGKDIVWQGPKEVAAIKQRGSERGHTSAWSQI